MHTQLPSLSLDQYLIEGSGYLHKVLIVLSAICTMLKEPGFLLFLLLIANSGNYLHLSIIVHYKTVCNNNVLSVNFSLNSNY